MKNLYIQVLALLALTASPAYSASQLGASQASSHSISSARAAVTTIAESIRRDPSNIDLRRNLSVKLLEAGQSAEAARQMQAVVALGMRAPEDFCLLADAYRFAGNYSSAILNYQEALGITPAYARARAGMALSYMQAGCPKLGEKVCLDGLAATANPAERRVLLGALKTAIEQENAPKAVPALQASQI